MLIFYNVILKAFMSVTNLQPIVFQNITTENCVFFLKKMYINQLSYFWDIMNNSFYPISIALMLGKSFLKHWDQNSSLNSKSGG